MLLTLTTIYNLLFKIKNERNNKERYTADDINQAHNHLDSKCKIRSLNPYLDKSGILRSQGLLQFVLEELQLAKLPIFRHARDPITRLYLEHRICIQQGTEAVKAFVQQRYLVIGLRKTLLSIRFWCFFKQPFWCQKYPAVNGSTTKLQVSWYPLAFPFSSNRKWFFWTFLYRRNQRHSYQVLQTHFHMHCHTRSTSCLDLNTDTFFNALRRSASQRCQSKLIRSDNGKKLVGANEELKRCVRSLDNQRLASELLIKNTVWKLNPPYGLQFGVAWTVDTNAKRIILIIIGSRRLTSDVFHAIMVDTENMVSSQLLKHVTDVPDNEEPINPNHFLVQRPYNSLPQGDFSSTMPASFKSWKNVQHLLNHFWRRLVKEYLPTLTKRFKWSKQSESLNVQGLVWILKDLTLRGIWPLGRIVETLPGKDGSVRVVKVKTADETVSHAFWLISRLCSLFSRNGNLGNASYPLVFWLHHLPLLWFYLWVSSPQSLSYST